MAGGKGGKGGSSGQASNAALQSDEDLLARRRAAFGTWKAKRKPKGMIDYNKSPSPPIKRS